MTTDIQNQQAQQQRQAAPLRLSRGEIISELSACLTLVRPVGMADDAATEWLAVAAGEVINMRPSAFKAGCAEARQECRHHGHIIPTILNGKTAQSWRNLGSSPFLPAPEKTTAHISHDSRAQKLIETAAKGCRT